MVALYSSFAMGRIEKKGSERVAYQTLLFDLDETLYAYEEGTIQALKMTALSADLPANLLIKNVYRHAKLGWMVNSPYNDYCQSIGISPSEGLWGYFENTDPTPDGFAAWIPEYQHRVWSGALDELGRGDDALAERLSETFKTARRQRHVIFPEVPALLEDLGQRFRLGLVTNGASDLQREKVAGAGLERYFQTIVVSGEVGVGKPDRRVFTRALDALNSSPDDAVMIGDSLRCDIGGAQAMGMSCIWIRSTSLDQPDPPPTATIVSVAELANLLG